VKGVGEAIVREARGGTGDGVAEQRGKPALARSAAPEREQDVSADDDAARLVRGMKPATHVLERRTMGRQSLRLELDVAKLDGSALHCGNQLVALTIDAGVANGATRIVPDHQVLIRHLPSSRTGRPRRVTGMIPPALGEGPP